MMICGPEYYLDLTPDKVDKVLDDLKKRYLERRKNQAPGSSGSSGTGPARPAPRLTPAAVPIKSKSQP